MFKEYNLKSEINLKISIIISVMNGSAFLEKTISSILNQEYPNLELVIIDGGSTDGSINIIKSFTSHKVKWISEPDKGISNAFNKGVNLANGDYINFQGDSDGFVNENSISKLFSNLNLSDKPIICGNIQRIDLEGKVLYKTKIIKKFDKKSLLFKMSLPHQGLFVPKEFFHKHGGFDENNKYCMDYEILLRAYGDFPNVICKETIIANWRADGLGEGKTIEILKEYNRIKIKNRVSNRITLFAIHVFTITKYYLKVIVNKITKF